MSQIRYSAAELAQALGQPPPTREQAAIIEHDLTPMLVVAGAGSGKTETMAARVVWLVANGLVTPDGVLGLTFTRKAAAELAERIGRRLRALDGLVPAPAQVAGGAEPGSPGTAGVIMPTVSTYNAYAGRIVAEHGARLGIEPDAALLGEALAWQLADACVSEYDGPMDQVSNSPATVTGAVLDLAGRLSEHLRTPEEAGAYLADTAGAIAHLPLAPGKRAIPPGLRKLAARCRAGGQLLPIVARFEERKRARMVLDFADQVRFAARLAMTHPHVARSERRRYQVVLLDEFQDTSDAQMRLLQALFARPDPHAGAVPVIAVGDPHQSIYGWRGASATTLTRFPEAFGSVSAGMSRPAPVMPLSTSWRNDRTVLDLANTIAAPLSARCAVPVARLEAAPGAGPGTVQAGRWPDPLAEAEAVAGWIARHWWSDPEARVRSGASAAVLCRRRAQFGSIVAALERRGLPVRVVGVGGLLHTPEVSDLVALIGVAADPSRSELLMRLLAGPVCRLGARDIDVFGAWARHRDRTAASPDRDDSGRAGGARPGEAAGLVDALADLPDPAWTDGAGRSLTPVALERLRHLAGIVAQVRQGAGQPLPELVAQAERLLGLEVELRARPHAGPATARANLDAFAGHVTAFAQTGGTSPQALLAYLDAARHRERGLDGPADSASPDAVDVLTVHAAKGLEWDVVAVPGLIEGGFPSHKARVVFDPAAARRGAGKPPAGPDGSGSAGLAGCPAPGDAGDPGTPAVPEPWTLREVRDSGWISALGELPYPLRGDADGLPPLDLRGLDSAGAEAALDDFARACGQHLLGEERRLAYVAFTRARHALLASASVWEQASTPRLASRFLDELLPFAQVIHWEPLPAGETGNPLSAGDEHRWPDAAGEQGRDDAEAVRACLDQARSAPGSPVPPEAAGRDDLTADFEALVAEWQQRSRPGEVVAVLPDHLSASAMVRLNAQAGAFAEELRRPMPQPPPVAARAGARFHAWVERRLTDPRLTDEPFPAAAGNLAGEPEAVAGGTDIGPADADEYPGGFPASSIDTDIDTGPDAGEDEASPGGRQRRWQENFLASQWAGRRPVAVELPLETVLAGVPVRGRVDAVFVRQDGVHEIVDWKTGRCPPPASLETMALQLGLYRIAYAQLTGLAEEQVEAAFFFASDGRTVRPPLPDRAAVERRLRDIPAAAEPGRGPGGPAGADTGDGNLP